MIRDITPKQLAIGSILVALCVLSLKYAAYGLTNSVGLYSDALESLVNLAAAIALLVAVSLGDKPADHNHPYGHHKAEYLSAVAEGVLIVLAAFAIVAEASETLFNPRTLSVPVSGLLLNGSAGILNAAWAFILIRRGRQLRSPALVADGKHLFTDVFSSVSVLGGVIVALATGMHWLDPLVAFLVALTILWTGWDLIRTSVGGLMDEAIEDRELRQIRDLIMSHAMGAIEAHDLRTRRSGRATFVEFHLVVASSMKVVDAHHICDRIEHALQDLMPHVHVTIHIEPEDMAHDPGTAGSMVF